LLHALVARAAADTSVRALAIKGPVVAMQGLRPPRSSADADVLVHPGDLEPFIDSLLHVGWRRGVTTTAALRMPMHSVNLLHDHWPVGLDLHHYFPGFLAEPADVFEALWVRRTPVVLAGVPVPACDRVGQAAIVALHLLRDTPSGRSAALDDLARRTAATFAAEDLAALVELAARTDATGTLGPFLLGLGIEEHELALPRSAEALDRWRRRQRVVGYEAWFERFAATPVRQWPRVARHALMLTDDEIYVSSGVAPGQGNLTRLRLRRIGRGVAGIPRTVRALSRERWQQGPRD
jgi:hypothetical protein